MGDAYGPFDPVWGDDDTDTDVEDILDNDEDESERQRTPVGATPIVLNPDVDDAPTPLQCPACEEPVRCVDLPEEGYFEYRCGCDHKRRFEITGAQ